MNCHGCSTVHLLLFAGFLGSGKTTLIIKLAEATSQAGIRVAIVVNEIGEIGLDEKLMRQLDLNVWELVNGCICCTLTGDLVTTLQSLDSDYAPELVILEASGAAEPGSVLSALKYYRGNPLESVCSAVLVDPLRLPMLLEVLTPLISAQIKHADLLIINKADLASPHELMEACSKASEMNPNAKLFSLSAKEGLEMPLILEFLPWLN
jgi:G3E family GTPase